MKDFFQGINEKLKESGERWGKIDSDVEELNLLRKHEGNHDIRRLWLIEDILLRLVEEMRPMSNASEQVESLQNEIMDMINNFEVKK